MEDEIIELIEKYKKRSEDVCEKYLKNNNPFYAGEQAICDLIVSDLSSLIKYSNTNKLKSLRNINVGDFVECIRINGQSTKCLTKGKTYEVINTFYSGYNNNIFHFSIMDDNNKRKSYKHHNGQFKALL